MITPTNIRALLKAEGFTSATVAHGRVLLDAADSLQRQNEYECSEPDESLRAQARKGADKALRKVVALVDQLREAHPELPLSMRLGGDPRGYALRLMLPSRRYNTWGGAEDGFGISRDTPPEYYCNNS